MKGTNPAKADSFAIKYEGRPTPNPETIMTYEVEVIKKESMRTQYKRTDRRADVTVPYIADYYATEQVSYPYAYIISVADQKVLDALRRHGIELKQLKQDRELDVSQYNFTKISPTTRLNQGHYLNQIEGEFSNAHKTFKAGTHYVLSSQKLAGLIAYLLEPEMDDNLLTWNFFDRYLVPQWGNYYFPYPVYRVEKPVDL